MDNRTKKIQDLNGKLAIARDFILRVGYCAIECADENKSMGNKHWAERAFMLYADTKPNTF